MKHNMITVWTNTIFLFYQHKRDIQYKRNKNYRKKLINNIKHLAISQFDLEIFIHISVLYFRYTLESPAPE